MTTPTPPGSAQFFLFSPFSPDPFGLHLPSDPSSIATYIKALSLGHSMLSAPELLSYSLLTASEQEQLRMLASSDAEHLSWLLVAIPSRS